MHDTTNDLTVIGGGIAGLTAALRAVECGLRTLILEQGSDERYPCNTRFSGGILHAAHCDVNRPAAELKEAIRAATFGSADPALADAVAEDGRRLLAWLRSNGVRFMRFGVQEAHRWGIAPPRPIAAGLDWRGRGPDVMLRELTSRFIAAGGCILLGARAIGLEVEGGMVAGVRFERGGRERRLATRAVVIADGGYQASPDLARDHICRRPELLLQRGAATGRGDGLRMALAVGAGCDRMTRFYGHLHGRAALVDKRLWPYPELDAVATAGVVVDATGSRFTDEGLGGIAIANAIATLDEPDTTVVIFDEAIWESTGRSGRIPANPHFERFGGEIVRARSVDALAARLGLPSGALENTLTAYNGAVARAGCEALTPPRSGTKIKPRPLAFDALCAIEVCVGITYTMGGIVIDGLGRVLRPDRSPIGGLYAAGATTTGLEGGGNRGVGYVGGLIKSVFALRAAEHAAANLLQRDRTVSVATTRVLQPG